MPDDLHPAHRFLWERHQRIERRLAALWPDEFHVVTEGDPAIAAAGYSPGDVVLGEWDVELMLDRLITEARPSPTPTPGTAPGPTVR